MPGELAPALARKLKDKTPEQIEKLAHACNQWAEFKEDLRTTSTRHKLEWLKMYLDTDHCMLTCCSDEMREIQVHKYLFLMVVSGLIEELPKDFSFADRRNWTKQLVVRQDWIAP